jgi:hypothetical protein
LIRRGDVSIAPGSPEMIHWVGTVENSIEGGDSF